MRRLVLIALTTVPAAFAQVPDLAGVWWAEAPAPGAPSEPPGMGMGMGMAGMGMGMGGGGGAMGVNAAPVMLSTFGQERMADFDPIDDPAVGCVQAGLMRQILSPYPMRIDQDDDRVVMTYEEWEIVRSFQLNGEPPPADEPLTPMGYALARYADGKFFVESTHIAEGLARNQQVFFWTSEDATVTEQYYVNARGQLVMDLVLTDPVMLSEPWVVQKVWNPWDGELLDFDCILRERP